MKPLYPFFKKLCLPNFPSQLRSGRLAVLAGVALLLGAFFLYQAARAEAASSPAGAPAPMHPDFPLLDASGENVLHSGRPVSTEETCGACHDTAFISSHTSHAGVGADPFPGPGEAGEGRVQELEMNCFLCHTPSSNNQAREAALQSQRQEWASTATLSGSGIVEKVGDEYRYLPEAFNHNGELLQERIAIQDPGSENCGQCHGTVHTSLGEPFTLPEDTLAAWRSALTGQVISPQYLSDSGLNLAGKEVLDRAFDVHAERGLSCTDCHYSLNNPVYFQEAQETRPEHLEFDPRRLELGEYLRQPVHEFAHGADAEGGEPSMRRCESCHSLEATHNWLPYKERHAGALSCESCHIPKVYTPALEQVDWTVLAADGNPRITLRGAGEDGLLTGYTPVMLSRIEAGGNSKLAPYNLVTTWFWVSGEPAQVVSPAELQAAFFEGGRYHPSLLAALDDNRNGELEEAELALEEVEEVQAVASRLEALGHQGPRIAGEVQPHSLNHGVAGGEWAVKDCAECHSSESRLEAALSTGSSRPGGTVPTLASGPGFLPLGEIFQEPDGKLQFRQSTSDGRLYVLGNDAVSWVDLFGSLAFIGVLLGVLLHGGLRFLSAMRRPRHTPALKRVYMYGVYERFWHWMQTFTILGLLFTGLVIHRPDTFGMFSFHGVVLVHNILAALVVINAGLSLFYHLASGEIRQYLPRPAGLLDQMVRQGLFYLRGIFKGAPHPFEKRPDQKLNPLQQITYFGLLNVLLPLQVLTGALMWGAQRWPELTARLGGLPFLGPFHSLIAWLLASFIVGHVYLTTTGHTPFASIQAMIMGWDELEAPLPAEEGTD